MAYELTVKNWSGPLEKLLELIEARELEIGEISLAVVTDDFLKYVEGLKKEKQLDLRVLADFIVVASRLLFIKSKSLLPDAPLTQDEEAEIKDLEERLQFYRELRPTMKSVSALWMSGNRAYSRPYFLNAFFLSPAARIFYPSPSATPENLKNSLQGLFAAFEKMARESETVKDTIISLEEKIQEIIGRLTLFIESKFRDLTESKSKSEIIVTFLALLHLAREERVILEQQERFSDIIIRPLQAESGK